MFRKSNRFLDYDITNCASKKEDVAQDSTRYDIAERYINDAITTVCELGHKVSAQRVNHISNDELAKISAKLLSAIWDIRRAIDYRLEDNQAAILYNAKCIPDKICYVESIDNAILRLTFPFLLSDSALNDWVKALPDATKHTIENDLLFITKTKVLDFLQHNPQISIPDGFVYLIYKRFVPAQSTILSVSDSNNIETGAITNGISQAIGISDNAYSMGFVCTAAESKTPRTEVTLINATALPYWLEYLQNDARKNGDA